MLDPLDPMKSTTEDSFMLAIAKLTPEREHGLQGEELNDLQAILTARDKYIRDEHTGQKPGHEAAMMPASHFEEQSMEKMNGKYIKYLVKKKGPVPMIVSGDHPKMSYASSEEEWEGEGEEEGQGGGEEK